MNKNEIFEIIKETIYEIVPELEGEEIVITDSLQNLGANSMDRMDILISTMEKISLNTSMVEFGGLKNIGEIVNVIHARLDGE